jgi:hypothetical protein
MAVVWSVLRVQGGSRRREGEGVGVGASADVGALQSRRWLLETLSGKGLVL